MQWPPKIPKGFPLTVHERGYVKSGIGWICGKKSPDEALKIYHDKAKRKLEGRKTSIAIKHGDEQTVEQLAERYVSVRLADAHRGDIRQSSYRQIEAAVAEFLEHAVAEPVPGCGGLRVAQIQIVDLVPDVFSDFIQAVRFKGDSYARKRAKLVIGMFRHAAEEDWITRPVKFGRRFREFAWSKSEPYKSVPPTPEQVRKLLAHIDARIETKPNRRKKHKRGGQLDLRAPRQFKAGVLLALNGGYGSSELAQLPTAVVDLDAAIIDYRRGKTGKDHVVPLWKETVEALRLVFEDIERTRKGDDLVFRTREGRPWAYEQPKLDDAGEIEFINTLDNFSQLYSKICTKLGTKIPRQSFYCLKDLHCSIADECTDQPAAYRLTGHQYHTGGRDPYVTVTIERLRNVTEFIRHRLFPPAAQAVSPATAGETQRGDDQAAA